MNNFFKAQRPVEFKAREFQTLKYRWGFSDGIFHKLKEASLQSGLDIERLLDLDVALIQRLGFHVKLNKDVKKKWLLK
jgi:hypothetical protein